ADRKAETSCSDNCGIRSLAANCIAPSLAARSAFTMSVPRPAVRSPMPALPMRVTTSNQCRLLRAASSRQTNQTWRWTGSAAHSAAPTSTAETVRREDDHGIASRSTIFHITEPLLWKQAEEAGSYTGSTRGQSLDDVGFIHCSYADQVEMIANFVY